MIHLRPLLPNRNRSPKTHPPSHNSLYHILALLWLKSHSRFYVRWSYWYHPSWTLSRNWPKRIVIIWSSLNGKNCWKLSMLNKVRSLINVLLYRVSIMCVLMVVSFWGSSPGLLSPTWQKKCKLYTCWHKCIVLGLRQWGPLELAKVKQLKTLLKY